jgi:hypothetical protein
LSQGAFDEHCGIQGRADLNPSKKGSWVDQSLTPFKFVPRAIPSVEAGLKATVEVLAESTGWEQAKIRDTTRVNSVIKATGREMTVLIPILFGLERIVVFSLIAQD